MGKHEVPLDAGRVDWNSYVVPVDIVWGRDGVSPFGGERSTYGKENPLSVSGVGGVLPKY